MDAAKIVFKEFGQRVGEGERKTSKFFKYFANKLFLN